MGRVHLSIGNTAPNRRGFTPGQIGAKIGGMMAPTRPVKITFARMREQAVRGLLVYCNIDPVSMRSASACETPRRALMWRTKPSTERVPLAFVGRLPSARSVRW
jgi:hypothetical protein